MEVSDTAFVATESTRYSSWHSLARQSLFNTFLRERRGGKLFTLHMGQPGHEKSFLPRAEIKLYPENFQPC